MHWTGSLQQGWADLLQKLESYSHVLREWLWWGSRRESWDLLGYSGCFIQIACPTFNCRIMFQICNSVVFFAIH